MKIRAASGAPALISTGKIVFQNPYLRFGFPALAGILAFAAVYARNSVYGSILRFKPFRSFGIIGYSAYLLQPLLIDVLRKLSVFYVGLDLNGVPLFVLTTLVTWLVASFTYNLIEYPFERKQTYLGQPA